MVIATDCIDSCKSIYHTIIVKVWNVIPNRCDVMWGVLYSTVCDTVSQWSMEVWLGSVGMAAFSTISLEFDISPMWGVLDTTVCETVCQLLNY